MACTVYTLQSGDTIIKVGRCISIFSYSRYLIYTGMVDGHSDAILVYQNIEVLKKYLCMWTSSSVSETVQYLWKCFCLKKCTYVNPRAQYVGASS